MSTFIRLAWLSGLLSCLFLATAPSVRPADGSGGFPDDGRFAEVWKDMSDISDRAAALAARNTPEKQTFLESLTLRQPRYAHLLKKAQEVLGRSEAGDLFERINRLQARNVDLRHEEAKLKRERITAPEESKNPLTLIPGVERADIPGMRRTRKLIDRRLEAIASETGENLVAMDALKQEICSVLDRSGLRLSPEEVGYFVISAEGSELFHLMMIAENMKKMQKAIEGILKEDGNNVDLARSHVGMYMISLDAYAAAHDVAMENISVYRGRIGGIVGEAGRNLREAQDLRRGAGGGDAANLDANIRINEKTIAAARMYDSLLERRLNGLDRSRRALKVKVDMARNTYRTISNGFSLISLVNAASNDHRLLTDFEMPELKTIYDTAMLNAFMDISEKIRAEK